MLNKLSISGDLLSGVNYYIENDSLVVYRSFQTYSIYDEQDYFTRADKVIVPPTIKRIGTTIAVTLITLLIIPKTSFKA